MLLAAVNSSTEWINGRLMGEFLGGFNLRQLFECRLLLQNKFKKWFLTITTLHVVVQYIDHIN